MFTHVAATNGKSKAKTDGAFPRHHGAGGGQRGDARAYLPRAHGRAAQPARGQVEDDPQSQQTEGGVKDGFMIIVVGFGLLFFFQILNAAVLAWRGGRSKVQCPRSKVRIKLERIA